MGETLTALLAFKLRHHCTKVEFQDLLSLLQMLLPENSLPDTNYLFNKAFCANTGWEMHHYCCNRQCAEYIGVVNDGKVFCSVCETESDISESIKFGCFFMYSPLENDLRDLFENGLKESMVPRSHSDDSITDVCDGSLHKNLPLLMDRNNISLTWNTDGIPVFESSNYSMWPIQCTINEMAIADRKLCILVPGIWFGQQKPNMECFLKPFVDDCIQLETTGFQWLNKQTNSLECTKVVNLLCTVDSVARAVVQNIKQFNGQYGCNFCEHPGERVEKGGGYTRVYPLSTPLPRKRTHESILHDSELATAENPVNGVKGLSPLARLEHFNMAESFVPDYLHAVLLGVVKQITGLWFDNKVDAVQLKSPRVSHQIDERLKSVRPPSEVTRLPRSVNQRRMWKGSEWKTFLFISPFVLLGLLPSLYFNHWLLLAFAVYSLTKSSINMSDLENAHVALCEFVLHMEPLYGKENVSFNIHLLTHLAESVRRHGPLSLTSAFNFESNGGQLLKLFNGTQHLAVQVTENLTRLKELNKWSRIYVDKNSITSNFIDQALRGYPLCKKVELVEHCSLFGSSVTQELPISHQIAAEQIGIELLSTKGTYFRRLTFNGTLYTTHEYSLKYSRCNSLITVGDKVLNIQHIVCVQTLSATEKVIILAKETQVKTYLKRQTNHVHVDSHMLHVQFTNNLVAIFPPQVTNKCIEVGLVCDGTIILPLSNKHERD